jgi:hypothetical protein
MIAMQYQFILPADYPMDNIEKRIREKGHILDGLPGLLFKAYLYSRKDAKNYKSNINSYAPFYIWQDTTAMTRFLQSNGFNALCEQFGRPQVQTWLLNEAPTIPDKESSLARISKTQQKDADVNGFNCQTWQPLNVQWLSSMDLESTEEEQYYCVGYIAYGEQVTKS